MEIERTRAAFAKLEFEYEPVAIRFLYRKPEGVEHTDKRLPLCMYVREAQNTGKHFYMVAEDETCSGTLPLGMRPKDGFSASGSVGKDYEVFCTPAANARLHATYQTLTPGAVRFVEFCPLKDCEFEADLIMCIANTSQACFLMRSTSYVSGDLWESRGSYVVNCAWMFAYPYLSGKVNFCITGMHYGMQENKSYPAGLHMISIPFQKIDQMVWAMEKMDRVPIGLREDAESKAEMARRKALWDHP